MSNWIIAIAACATVVVYGLISGQIAEQIRLAKEQIELTRGLFLESHAPALSVSFEKCSYSKNDARLDGVIVIRNHGAVAAKEIDLRIEFGGTRYVRPVTRVAIQPGNKLTYPFALSVTEQMYENQTQGNRLNSYVSGSYKGLSGTEYRYNEKAEFYAEFRKFVPFWTE
jgi:hypothetical protein